MSGIDNQEKQTSFVLYTSTYKMIKLLSPEQKGALLDAIFSFYGECEKPEMDQATEIVYSGIEDYMIENREKYLKKKAEKSKQARAAVNSRWEKEKQKKAEEEKRIPKDTGVYERIQENTDEYEHIPKIHVSVSDSVSVSDNNISPSSDGEKTGKSDKQKQVEKDAEEMFERLWQRYPNKKGKADVSKTQKVRLYKIGEDKLAKALDRYNAEVKGRDKRYIQHGSRWFNKSYVDYLDENYQSEPSADTKAPAADQHAKNILDLFERAHAVCN